jgi:methionyl-tRNA formyltransferase
MKIIFMGTPHYAEAILEKLIQSDGIEVVAVYTQPDKPVGRKKVLTPPEVKVLALKHEIALFQPHRLRESEVVAELLKIECDYIVVAAYGQILPKAVLEHAPCINLHASILPHYRGASPIQQTLLHGDDKTGVTAMLMDEGLDTGAILKIQELEVPHDMMAEELFDALTEVASELTLDVVKNFATYMPSKQDENLATHCKKITKEDGLISFSNASELYNKYRAFTPWPGIYLESGLKIKKMLLHSTSGSYEPGEILEITPKSIIVGCSEGSLEIITLQPPSKNEMDVLSYIRGKRLAVADYLS